MKKLFEESLILDGAMGSMLMELTGCPVGFPVERLCLENPSAVLSVHQSYVKAGADAVYTNTFGANLFKFSPPQLKDIITAAIDCAKKSGARYVGLDIGPLGKIVGSGGISFDEAYENFKEIVLAARDETDFIVVETMTSIAEMRAAILAVKENSSLPLLATMSFGENKRTFFGTDAKSFAVTASSLGADAIGANCSLGPVQLYKIAKDLTEVSPVPVAIKPNAGMPSMAHGRTYYDVSPLDFALAMAEIKKLGVNILGGCCGTTPEHIGLLKEKTKDIKADIKKPHGIYISSQTDALKLEGNLICGERINPTGKKRVQQAALCGDFDFLVLEGIKQQEQGANILDVNIGVSGIDEKTAMLTLLKRLQEVVTLPLQIDSSKPEVLEAALRLYHGRAIVNSVSGKKESLDRVLPLVKKYGALVIALTMDENGIPETAEERIEIALNIAKEAEKYGIERERIIVDTLTLAEASKAGNALVTLNALKLAKERGFKTTLGVSNISFGMPHREDINAAFLELAVKHGLDIAIINPAMRGLCGSSEAIDFLLSKENALERYLSSHTGVDAVKRIDESNCTLSDAIVTGQATLSYSLAKEIIKEENFETLSSKYIIPALDEVGKLYESGKVFLPQLIAAADAAKEAFRAAEEEKGALRDSSLGTFIIATVKGDVHDIGKNIVKTIVANYGFKVVDLGRDVDYNIIKNAVEQHYPCVLGLSALMTTTAENMAKTIDFVREDFDIPILCGGAVITQEYAASIGGIYCRDAGDAVKKLKEIFRVRQKENK
ncbi:MAG: dihydropteroate synthase [Clostridiales bacterium]|nr:dihydropteroate synthase [Clostridiales bacterium]